VIAVSFDSGVIGLYDAGRGQELRLLIGHTAAVSEIAFAADGRLASASEDGTILIWAMR
jgi:WD40 repeat protein